MVNVGSISNTDEIYNQTNLLKEFSGWPDVARKPSWNCAPVVEQASFTECLFRAQNLPTYLLLLCKFG